MNYYAPPSAEQQAQYAVNRPGQREVIWQPLYDYSTYAAAGQTSLSFFQNPIGAPGKTDNNTNMELAGQLPSPQKFLVKAITIDFFPTALPGRDNDPLATNFNDVYEFFQAGVLKFDIGSKNFLRQAPLGKFPPTYRLAGAAAITGESAATTVSIIDYATVAGKEFGITPFMIPATQNFKVTLEWDAAIAITADAVIGVNLWGFLWRDSQ